MQYCALFHDMSNLTASTARRMSYSKCIKLAAAVQESYVRPTTQTGRIAARKRARTYVGVNHDWNKGVAGKHKALTSSQVTVNTRDDVTPDRVKLVMNSMASIVYEPGYELGNMSIEHPPVNADIEGAVHVVTVETGFKKMPELYRLPFKSLLRILRERENVSMDDLAIKIKKTQACISRWELGKAVPRIEAFCDVVNSLHLSSKEFELLCFRYSQVYPAWKWNEEALQDKKEEKKIKRHMYHMKEKAAKQAAKLEMSDSSVESEEDTTLKMAGHPVYIKPMKPKKSKSKISTKQQTCQQNQSTT